MKRYFIALALMLSMMTLQAAESIYKPVAPKERSETGKILIISGDKFNDTELLYPLYRLMEEGYEVVVASPNGGTITGSNSATLPDTRKLADLKPNPKEYRALYLPGGKAPADLRKDKDVLDTVKAFAAAGRPIGAICHGPQILVTADLVNGKRMTSVKEVASEITDAKGNYVDEAVVVDGNFITSRLPGDLPAQMKVFVDIVDDVDDN